MPPVPPRKGKWRAVKLRLAFYGPPLIGCIVLPVGIYAAWKVMVGALSWSHGGREAHLEYLKEQFASGAHKDDPMAVITGSKPLSHVPQHITELPTGDASAAGRAW